MVFHVWFPGFICEGVGGGGGGGYGGCYRVNAPVLEWSSMFGSLVLYGGGDFMEGTNFISINAIPLPVQY